MNKKAIIVYYSWSGNTRKIAKLISEQIDADLFEVKPINDYPENYSACVDQANREIKNGFMPQIKDYPESLGNYDLIFIGTPNWWSTMAPPLLTLLKNVDLSGKSIIPFCTHGGGGAGHFVKDVKRICKNSVVLKNFELYGNGGSSASKEIFSWLKEIDIIEEK